MIIGPDPSQPFMPEVFGVCRIYTPDGRGKQGFSFYSTDNSGDNFSFVPVFATVTGPILAVPCFCLILLHHIIMDNILLFRGRPPAFTCFTVVPKSYYGGAVYMIDEECWLRSLRSLRKLYANYPPYIRGAVNQ